MMRVRGDLRPVVRCEHPAPAVCCPAPARHPAHAVYLAHTHLVPAIPPISHPVWRLRNTLEAAASPGDSRSEGRRRQKPLEAWQASSGGCGKPRRRLEALDAVALEVRGKVCSGSKPRRRQQSLEATEGSGHGGKQGRGKRWRRRCLLNVSSRHTSSCESAAQLPLESPHSNPRFDSTFKIARRTAI